MTHTFQKYTSIIVVAIIVISAGIYFLTKDGGSSIDFVIALKADLIQEVSVTGRVKPSESVDLAFEGSGRVSRANISIGDIVSKGELLIQLQNGQITAELAKAKANVKLQAAKLEELKRGPTQEEIEVQKVKVESAKAQLVEAKRNLVVKINDAFTKSDDAVRNNVDQFINNPLSSDPQIAFQVINSSLESSIENSRVSIESILDTWQDSVDILTLESDFEEVVDDAKQNLSDVKAFLNDVSLAVNTLTASANYSQATIDGYRSDVSTARTNVNTALSNLSAAEEKLQTAESSVILEKQELSLKTAGTRVEQITAQEAKVEEAEALVRSKQAEIDKTYLFAPINGVVTLQEAKVGEIITAREIIVTLISQAEFEIEAKVPEADIAKIKIGDIARVTLDAYGSDIEFIASVVSIDPAETIIEGVATYKTVLYFTDMDNRIRSGMTANIDIKTAEKDNVISIPSRAVITKNGKRTVRILDTQNNVVEIEVVTGLRSSEGSIEIIDGIKEGDKVIVFLEE
ncbi:MAG: efflux RND transporter periplasmic adaptor subunit [Candidatus Pacebacteria bacterium]|jgi:multidrug efflux pump subunit AcrA (membrane-fusion protein)|nr:efflux RND transporter periplasmic adaptor subunit [Candidatus Paceibacterota bacterium]MDP7159375.1 efflux RND transporter periplasmic adaptor subunit [Candidatus Paceibacterota bacterium]MDP7366197.1 efflux RND transporter periplasmic adaptor subunit [Candidatus Paceibacterota bacterium]MDP7466266.1 efflux RND transporter periplasmic adaptor subunit [Candidatus Paceibacterota bacterium]MDP7648430.1 efflux RND transporter periplasmic adaptor subunit [Candidatus Paceibacterota bacterium]|tara:strand:- start:2243 stop:3793 length:1551 start_codon:yes stop_codon:yes gene_type:complete